MTANKITQTPAEQQNGVQGHQHWHQSVSSFNLAPPATTSILARKVVREPGSIEEVVVSASNNGSVADTLIDVKKNGVTVLSGVITLGHAAADGVPVIAAPATDALAKVEVGDVITIESGATVATGLVALAVDARVAKRFA